MNLEDPKVKVINKELEAMEEKDKNLEHEIQNEGHKFSGIAFVSFMT